MSEVVYVNAGGVRAASRVFGYDTAGRVSSDVVREGSAGAVSVSTGWGYNADGSVASETVSVAGNPASGVWSYTYDRAGRLTGWARAGQPAVAYTYDRAGNRTGVRTGATTVGYTYDARNRLVGSPQGSHVWDAAGRLDRITNAAGTVADYGFDGLGRLTSLTQGGASVAYTYDALDRVAARNGTAFTYAGGGWDPVGDGTQRFSQSPSGRLQAVAAVSGAGRVVVSNRHGDLRALLDPATGTVTDSVLTDPFGVPVTRTGTMNPRVGFQGDWTEPVTGDTWMGARWYTPGTATFRSRDTVHGILTTPVSLNRYTYAHNNPIAYWDPDGRCVFCAAAPYMTNKDWGKYAAVTGDTGLAAASIRNNNRRGGPRNRFLDHCNTACIEDIGRRTAELAAARAAHEAAARQQADDAVVFYSQIRIDDFARVAFTTWDPDDHDELVPVLADYQANQRRADPALYSNYAFALANGGFDPNRVPDDPRHQTAYRCALHHHNGGTTTCNNNPDTSHTLYQRIISPPCRSSGCAIIDAALGFLIPGAAATRLTTRATTNTITHTTDDLGNLGRSATEAAGSGARFVAASDGVITDFGPRASSARPVVIGEAMEGRVVPAARQLGADWYQPPALSNTAQSMAHNRFWIDEMMNQGRSIIDIGPAAGRAGFPEVTSPWFAMERGQIAQRGYGNYMQFPWDW